MPTVTYRPTSDLGGYHEIVFCYPSSPTTHYDKVDDVSPDWSSTYISTLDGTEKKDTFRISGAEIPGRITNVKVYASCKQSEGAGYCRPLLWNPNSGAVSGTLRTLSNAYASYYSEFTVDPFTSLPFESNAFQTYGIGVSLKIDGTIGSAICTQLYVVIEYATSGGQVRVIGMMM